MPSYKDKLPIQTTINFDTIPTIGSTNAVTSGGIYNSLILKQDVLTNPVTGTGTAGQVSYWSGTGTQTGSAELTWDNVNKRLGAGVTTPLYGIHHVGTAGAAGIVSVRDFTFNAIAQISQRASFVGYVTDASRGVAFGAVAAGGSLQSFANLPATAASNLILQPYGGDVSLGFATSPSARLHVRGSGTTSSTTALLVQNSTPSALLTILDNGASTFSSSVTANSFVKSGGTSTQYLMADGNTSTLTNPVTGTGTAGQVAYWSGTGTQTGSADLFWDAANGRLGVGTNAPAERLSIQTTTSGATTNIFHAYSNSGAQSAFRVTDLGNGIFRNYSSIGPIINNGYGAVGSNYYMDGGSTRRTNGDSVSAIDFLAGGFRFVTAGNGSANSLISFTTVATIAQGGDMGLGISTTTPSARLHVRGSGTTSSTTALLVQNSTPTAIMACLDSRTTWFGSSTGYDGTIEVNLAGHASRLMKIGPFEITQGAGANWTGQGIQVDGANRTFIFNISNGNTTDLSAFTFNGGNVTAGAGFSSRTSGTINWLLTNNAGFAPTSGTAVFNQFALQGTINQTGGANGITRGLYVNPTLTAAADWRSVEWSNNTGWGLYGAGTAANYLAGNTSIGTTTSSGRLTVQGSGTTSSTKALVVNNSTPTAMFEILDNGRINQTIPSATDNTIFGTGAGDSVSLSGVRNTFYGRSSGNQVTSGDNNTFIGFYAGLSITTSRNNVMVGSQSGLNNTSGQDNTFIGFVSGQGNGSSSNNTYLGAYSGQNSTGANNTFIGWSASLGNTSGARNTSLGTSAGRYAGSGTTANQTSSDSIYIGYQSRSSANGNANEVVIGYDALGNGSNTVTIGNTSITATYLRGDINYTDGGNFVIGTTTGTKIGTATSQKIGFYNATPVVQRTTTSGASTLVGGGGTALTDTDTFDGYTLATVVKALRDLGLLA